MQTRDPRATNAMDPETLIVHRRLEAWGRWNAENVLARKRHIIDRLMEYGPNGAGSGEPPISMPEAIDETDQAIDVLPPPSRDRIRRYYLHWEPVEVSAHCLRMSARDFRRRLHDDRWRVGVVLDLMAARK